MLLIVDSDKPMGKLTSDLETAVKRHKFSVIGEIDMRQRLQEKGIDFTRECRIFEVCNAPQAQRVLEVDPRISTALPCRISVYEEGDQRKLATILPSAMLEMFGHPQLREVAREVEEALTLIMNEAAREA